MDALYAFLKRSPRRTVALSLPQNDSIVGGLATAAWESEDWWHQPAGHARAWLDCCRKVVHVDLDEEIVVFSPGWVPVRAAGTPR